MELLTDDIIREALEADGIMEEPDAPWLLEYINTEYGATLDTTTDWCDDKYKLKIYSESTADSYDIYWCTHDERPYVCQDGYYYEDHNEWSDDYRRFFSKAKRTRPARFFTPNLLMIFFRCVSTV